MHLSVVALDQYFREKLGKTNFQGVKGVVFEFDKARNKGYGDCKAAQNTIKGGSKGCT
jgi:hypothetical protein